MLCIILLVVLLAHEARSELLLTVTPIIVEPEYTSVFTIRCSLLEQEEGVVERISIYRTAAIPRDATKELVAELHNLAPITPRTAPGFEKLTVQGQISQLEEAEIGTFLEFVFPEPKFEDLGLYTCEAAHAGEAGEYVTEEAPLVLYAEVRVTTSDLVTDRLFAAVLALEKQLQVFNGSIQEINTRLGGVEEAHNETARRSHNETARLNATEQTLVARKKPIEETYPGAPDDEQVLEWLKSAVVTLDQTFEAFNQSVTRLISELQKIVQEEYESANETDTDIGDANDVIRNYFLQGNSSYFLFRSSRRTNTSGVQIACQNKSLYLAEINDAEEFQAICNEICRSLPDGSLVLVGGKSGPGQDVWTFQNSQEVVNFSNWGQSEPVQGEISGERCLALQKSEKVFEVTAVDCSSNVANLHFLCERDQ